ncbi:hypothetical protein BFV94_2498 [Alteromonas macleodii]|nr:hypothetical protein BFV94_2498 [Alteromonas macleodii]OES41021.1 hypothetical protein BFV96_2484 [Alteromonas macleodii]
MYASEPVTINENKPSKKISKVMPLATRDEAKSPKPVTALI